MRVEDRLLEPWVRLVRRRWRTGAGVFGVVLGLGVLLLFLTPPIYRSEATLRLGEPPPQGGVNPAGGVLSFLQLGGDPFANDMELLGSRSLAEGVTEARALNVTLDAPEGWHRDSLLAGLRATRQTEEARFAVRWVDDELEIRRTAPTDSVVGRVPPGVPITVGGMTVSFQPRREGMPRELELATLPFREATRLTRAALRFERPRREANVVAISYDDPDPGLADGVVSATVAEFVRLRTDLQHRESTQAADSLREVARETGRELRDAEDALESLQRTRRLVAPTAQSEALVERQAELLTRLARARSELEGVDRMLDRLDDLDDPARSWTALLSYPTFLENETLGSMLLEMTELHAEREELATRRTPSNTELRLLDERIAYLDESLRTIAREYRTGLTEQIAAVEPQVAELDSVLAALPAHALELARRERDVRLLSEILILTEQRLRQEELREALTYANVQVVDPPALRDRPVWPRKTLGLAVVLLLAGGSALLGIVVRDRTDPHLRRVRDVEDALGGPVLAVVGPPTNGKYRLDAAETRLLERRAGAADRGLTVIPVDGAPSFEPEGPDVQLRRLGPLERFSDAATAAVSDAPAVLVVEAGRTRRAEVRRAARWIEEAGGSLAGAILLCDSDRAVRRAWE